MPFLFGKSTSSAPADLKDDSFTQKYLSKARSTSSRSSRRDHTMGSSQSTKQRQNNMYKPYNPYRSPSGNPSNMPKQRDDGNSVWSPPPYTPSAPKETTTVATPARNSGDSAYAFLREFDTIFVVDDSSSMRGQRWKEAEEAIAAITPICTQHDPDGIDIYFLNHRDTGIDAVSGAYTNITTAEAVQEIFKSVSPAGATPFGNRLYQILNPYLRRVEAMAAATDEDGNLLNPALFVRPLNIIAITDGAFTDDAESVIVRVARRLDSDKCKALPWQVGIQFFQVGDDLEARKHLEELDDELSDKVRNEHIRDIVDTVPWRGESGQTLSGDGILKVVLGAVNKKYDRRSAFA
ncbi:hypothetical protein VTN77DRAFT_8025 [Rasamsonia byssochlamydoides]|uniref:uncharacterized protein n=1 Tax=Rasamsonia byssochlamydoides TaxID=89139 RepID=UPI003742157F